jgi:hypothetical protein
LQCGTPLGGPLYPVQMTTRSLTRTAPTFLLRHLELAATVSARDRK